MTSDVDWTPSLAEQAVEEMSDLEKRLLFRVADARGRVPMSELTRDFGLPGETAPEQDFPTLTAFCAGGEDRPAMPVAVGGSGSDGWYWMPKEAARMMRRAVRRSYEAAPGDSTGAAAAAATQQPRPGAATAPPLPASSPDPPA